MVAVMPRRNRDSCMMLVIFLMLVFIAAIVYTSCHGL